MLYWNLAVNPDLVLGLARRTSPFNTNGREGTKLSHNFLNLTHVPLESANNRTYGYFSTPSMCWGRVLPHWTPEALWSAFVSVQPVKTCEESNMQEKAYVFFFCKGFYCLFSEVMLFMLHRSRCLLGQGSFHSVLICCLLYSPVYVDVEFS